MGGKSNLIPSSAETGTDPFPTLSKAEFSLPSVFFYAGQNMGSVENVCSGSVRGCSATPAGNSFHSLYWLLFWGSHGFTLNTQTKEEKREGGLRVCSCHLNYDGGLYWGARKPIILHGTWPWLILQGMDFLYTFLFFFFLVKESILQGPATEKIPGFFGRIPCSYTARIFCAPAHVHDPHSQHIQGHMRIFWLRAESDHLSCTEKLPVIL